MRCSGVIYGYPNMLCRICSVWENLFFFLRWDFQVSLWRLQEGAFVLMRCECFRCYHHQIPDQIRTNLVCRSFPGWLYRWLLEFMYEGSRPCLSLMRRIPVLIVALLMESLVAYYLVLLRVSDCEMSARLEQRVVSGATGTSIHRRLDFVVWQRLMIRRSHSIRLRRGVSLCR